MDSGKGAVTGQTTQQTNSKTDGSTKIGEARNLSLVLISVQYLM